MAENAQKIVAANKGTIRHSVAVADVTTEYKSWTSAKIGGVDWTMGTDLRTDDDGVVKVGVFLHSDTVKKEAEGEIRASFDVRLDGVHPDVRSKAYKFTTADDHWTESLAVWSEVIDAAFGFVVDGRITVEIDITVDEVKFLPPAIDASDTKLLYLSEVEFADMRVKVKDDDWEGILCHKALMCRLSEAIHGAMTNASTTEAKSGVFAIGDPFATNGGIEQYVRLNYEDWKEETMDKHAVELFVLGQVLLCRRVKVLATLAIKRLLSVDTFWPTLKAAVRIDDEYVLHLCALFAGESFDRLTTLINTEDGQAVVSKEDKEGAEAFLVLMKAIGEKNKK